MKLVTTYISVKKLRSIIKDSDSTQFLINDAENHKDKLKDLKESIKLHGLKNPILMNTYPNNKMTIHDGHHRAIVLLELGYKRIPVSYWK